MVDPNTEYEFVSSQVRYHNEKIIEAFNLFIKLFSGVVGGSIWLRLQTGFKAAEGPSYARIADILVGVLAAIACLMVFENLRAWHGYRWAQARLGELDDNGKYRIPPPRTFRASMVEGAMIVTIAAATGLYWYFNPLVG